MNDIITAKSEKGRAIIDYLTRELGLPGNLRSLKVDVSSGVFVVDCQFLAPGSVESDEPQDASVAEEKSRQRVDYLERECGQLAMERVHHVARIQFLEREVARMKAAAPASPADGSPVEPLARVEMAAHALELAMAAVHGVQFSVNLMATEITKVGDQKRRYCYWLRLAAVEDGRE